jgi:hypothetical protein
MSSQNVTVCVRVRPLNERSDFLIIFYFYDVAVPIVQVWICSFAYIDYLQPP